MKIKPILLFFALILVMITVSRCYYDSEEFLYPQISNNCDTTKYSFDTLVSPIIQANCLDCHGTNTAAGQGTFLLVSYDDVKAHTDRLVGSIAHEIGYSAMPLGRAKLENCQIVTIRTWVNKGALHN